MSAAPTTRRGALVAPAAALTAEEMHRYSRHILLPEIGELGQRRLTNARVLVLGAGGLGSPVLLYLAAAGVGTLGIVDDDHVDTSNLQRQVIHGVSDLGSSKLESARATIAEINPLVSIRLHSLRLDASNALELFADYDLVVDGTDNFATRYLASDAAAMRGIPHVWGAVSQFDGQLSVFWAGRGPSYRDLYPDAPPSGAAPSCGESGVLGALCGVIGSLMAAEVIKLITGVGEPLLGRVLFFNALSSRWRELVIERDPDAGAVTALVDYAAFCGAPTTGQRMPGALAAAGVAASGASLRGDAAERITPERIGRETTAPELTEQELAAQEITVQELAALLERRHRGEADFELIDVREPGEHALVRIPGSTLLPLGRILAADGPNTRSPDRDIVLYCKVGVRSESALAALRSRGHRRVRCVTGGVLAWVAEIDPTLPTY